MKKLFLIPLLACFSCVMAWGATRTAGTFQQLQDALAAAAAGDVIELTADIAYPKNGEGLINITKSITLDGKGHKISGYGKRGSVPNVIAINYNNTSYVDVTLKNLDIYSTEYRPLETRGYITKLTLDNVTITSTGGSSNPQGLTMGGYQTSEPYAQLVIKDSKINLTHSGYPVIFWNPANVTLSNSDFNGYCGLYFKTDAKHSVVNADACNFDAPNVHSGASNDFAVFALEDGDMTFNLNNCGMNGERLGNQGQSLFSLSEWTLDENRGVGAINITLSGDNSYFNVSNDVLQNGYIWKNPSGTPDYGPKSEGYYKEMAAEDAVNVTVNFTITGGTYSVNPANLIFKNNFYMTKEGDEWVEHYDAVPFTIPAGYEVKEITTQQGGLQTTLYRVRKIVETTYGDAIENPGGHTVSYTINSDVENQGDGQNKNTEFLIRANETVDVPSDAVIANYVEVSNNATLTIPDGTQLEVTNGLDVTGGAKVVIEAGSTVVVGEGGVTSESTESIVITADENGSASFLLDPEVIVNTTPNLTVKMKAKAIGYDIDDEKEYYWFRFAAPVAGITELGKDKDRPTYIYKWNYGANEWSSISGLHELTPFLGYTLTTEYEKVDTDADDVEYTFHGQLAGNQNTKLQFQSRGYNYFGNSYTGYISVLALVEQLMDDANIDGTVYMWDNNHQRFEGVPLAGLRDNPDDYADWKKEVAPMQTFILRQIGTGEAISTDLNYASAIWGNPRYGRVPAPAPAPRRQVSDDNAAMTIVVTAANGSEDEITLNESAELGDEFNKGYDVVKFMNERLVNMYATVDGENYSTVATDNLEGKTISLQTVKSLNYTLSFKNVRGEEYAIRDNVTGAVIAIEEGATYEFAAQPKSTIEGRFEIVSAAKMPTAIENAQIKANAKGIYTIMGQYLGENFDVLPAGIYVVNGVKIVK